MERKRFLLLRRREQTIPDLPKLYTSQLQQATSATKVIRLLTPHNESQPIVQVTTSDHHPNWKSDWSDARDRPSPPGSLVSVGAISPLVESRRTSAVGTRGSGVLQKTFSSFGSRQTRIANRRKSRLQSLSMSGASQAMFSASLQPSTVPSSRGSGTYAGAPAIHRDYTIIAKLHMLRELRQQAVEQELDINDNVSISVTSSAEMDDQGTDVRRRAHFKPMELSNILCTKGVGSPVLVIWKNGRKLERNNEPHLKRGYRPIFKGKAYTRLLDRTRNQSETVTRRVMAFSEACRDQVKAVSGRPQQNKDKKGPQASNKNPESVTSNIRGSLTAASRTDNSGTEDEFKLVCSRQLAEERRQRLEAWVQATREVPRSRFVQQQKTSD